MKLNPKSFVGVGRSTPYLAWAAEGLSPAEIRRQIITTLSPYLEKPSILDELPIEVLGFEAVSIHRFSQDPWGREIYKGILTEYRHAYAKDAQASIEAFSMWQEALLRAQSEFTSLHLLELDKDELDLDEFRVQLFRDLGAVLEACIQPHLKALVQQVRLRRSRCSTMAALQSAKMGVIVDELSRTLYQPDLVAPPPWRLKLHVFRNIAQHHTSVLRGAQIACTYQSGQTIREVTFSRGELLAVAQQAMKVLAMLRSARTIFYLDHSDVIPELVTAAARPNTAIFMLSVAVATQGFEVISLEVSDSKADLIVQDVTDQDARDRGIHASQFLVQLWSETQSSNLSVTYFDRGGLRRFSADAKGSDCKDIAEERVSFEVLARRAVFRVY